MTRYFAVSTRLFVVALVATSSSACSRYMWVPDYMAEDCAPKVTPSRTGLPLDTASLDGSNSGIAAGKITSESFGSGIDNAVVTLFGEGQFTETTDGSGQFGFSNIPAGTYRFNAWRIGYQPARDSIRVRSRGTLHVNATLQLRPLDGPCSGWGKVRVRKPWWRFW